MADFYALSNNQPTPSPRGKAVGVTFSDPAATYVFLVNFKKIAATL